MQLHRLNHAARRHTASALVMVALVALAVVAAPAGARPEYIPQTSPHQATTPVVAQTIAPPDDQGIGTLGFVLIGVAAGAAILGAGYLGARIATRPSKLRVS